MLDPSVAATRRAVRRMLEPLDTSALAVALSGGPDSLALTAASIFEAHKLGARVTTITVDHGLQDGSDVVAARAADVATHLGADDVVVVRAQVADSGDGPEAEARTARYRALAAAAAARGIGSVLLGHTLDDQAETVLLQLTRGAGAASLAGMAEVRRDDDVSWIRPFLDIRRDQTIAACDALGLEAWADPHNEDDAFRRVRVRRRVLPMLERELGPGVAEALARTAAQLREDAEAFRAMIDEVIEDVVEPADGGIAVSVGALQANPAAIRNRIIRHVVAIEFGASLTRQQTLDVARLVTDWRGQGPIDLPGCAAERRGARLSFTARHSPSIESPHARQ